MDDFIRESFSENDNDFLNEGWDTIHEKLNNSATDLDAEIEEAFNFNEALPVGSWEIIQDGLDVETVWGRLLAILNKKKLRILYVRWVGLLALLISSSALFFLKNDDSKWQRTVNHEQFIGKFEFKRESNSKMNFENFAAFKSSHDLGINSEQNQQTLIEASNYNGKDANNEGKSAEHFVNKQELNQLPKNEIKLIDKQGLTPIPNVLNSVQFNDGIAETPIKIEKKRVFETGFSLGGFTQLSYAILTDPENSHALSKNSNAKSKFELSTAYGLTGGYTFKSGIFIETSIFVKNSIKRSIGTYEKLTYTVKRTELDYQSVYLNVGKKLPLNYAKTMTFNFALGGYYSRLRSGNIYRNEVLIDNNPNLNKNDFGLNCKLTLSRRIKNFSAEVGLNSSFGLKNIKSSQTEVNSALSHGSLISNGIYFGLSYHF